MIELLDPENDLSRGGVSNVGLSFIINKDLANIKAATKYYKEVKVMIKSNHIIKKIIDMLDFDYETPMEVFRSAQDLSDTISVINGLVTSEFRGTVLNNDFNYEKGYVIASVENGTSLDVIKKTYLNNSPMKLVFRESTGSYFELPTYDSTKIDGFGAFTIDIPILAVSYYTWKKINDEKPEELKETLDDYIVHSILVPMITDAARLSYLRMFLNGDFKVVKSNVPFSYVDQTANLHKEISKLKTSFNIKTTHHTQVLKELPGYDLENMYRLVPELELGNLTNMNRWFKILVESTLVNSVLTAAATDKDKDIIIRFKVMDRTIRGSGTLRKAPTPELRKYLTDIYNDTLDLIPKI